MHAERAEPPDAYLPDANILSIARSLRLGLPELTGCVPEEIAVPLVALDECLITTSPTHPRRAEYLRPVLDLMTIDTATPDIGNPDLGWYADARVANADAGVGRAASGAS